MASKKECGCKTPPTKPKTVPVKQHKRAKPRNC
jgi:hypothetical protein